MLAGAIVAASAEPAAAGLDLKMISLTKRNSDPGIEQVARVGDRAGFTFSVKTENVGDKYIPWGFPMLERRDAANLDDPTKTTPWVKDNIGTVYPGGNPLGFQGFSGATEGLNTPHTLPMPDPAPGPRLQDDATAKNFVGSHPHLQLTLWAQPGGSGPWQQIGCSDLKHAFSTVYPAGGGDDYPAFSGPAEIDDYGNDSDRDRDFYGPMSEMNATTFEVAKHLHLADADHGDETRNFLGTDARGYNVYERDHGQKEHTGAGHEIDHLLQADVLSLLKTTEQFNGMNGRYDVDTKWYAAGTWYVFGDTNPNDNTSYRQFDPGWDGTEFVPTFMGASFDGSVNNAPALFLSPCMDGAAFVPEPGSLSLFGPGTLMLLCYRWQRRKHAEQEYDYIGSVRA